MRMKLVSSGSSPRTWGTDSFDKTVMVVGRFIPTDVGNSMMRANNTSYWGGSSPRTWGTAALRRSWPERRRFIPTDVGNSSTSDLTMSFCTVHPHGRGEQTLGTAQGRARFGSSPRTWGTESRWCCCLNRPRFIPTDVGNSFRLAQFVGLQPVHPHGRGEQLVRAALGVFFSGSSPRTWGTVAAKHMRP